MKNNEAPLDISYLELRRAIGFMGMGLPFALIIGSAILHALDPGKYCTIFQGSVSCYYHSAMRNVFEGVIWLFGIFLLFYRYEKTDTLAAKAAGICALGVANCPPFVGHCDSCCITCAFDSEPVGNLHLAFAGIFFLILACMSLFLFTRTHKGKTVDRLSRKWKRNVVYRICGWTIIGCLVLIAVYMLTKRSDNGSLQQLHPVFWLETVMLLAFGVSWIVKGDVLLKDL
ncbi:MAG TPA: DUF998 domain-containing protein [Bacteroidia bacterium]|nr:DUF998 domain-containing protein [Bacteroidia bacterium]